MLVVYNYLFVGAILFVLGALGFLTRRNLILMMLSAEMMLHGVGLNLVAFSNLHGSYQGQSFTAFVLTVAACEAGLALAIILALYHRRKTLDATVWTDLGEATPDVLDAAVEDVPDQIPVEPLEHPTLTPAGHLPRVRRVIEPRGDGSAGIRTETEALRQSELMSGAPSHPDRSHPEAGHETPDRKETAASV